MDKISKKVSILFLAIFSTCFAAEGYGIYPPPRERFICEGLLRLEFDFPKGDVDEGKCTVMGEKIFGLYQKYISRDSISYRDPHAKTQLREIIKSEIRQPVSLLFDGNFNGKFHSKNSSLHIFGQVEGKLVEYDGRIALFYLSFSGQPFVVQVARYGFYDQLDIKKGDPNLLKEVDVESKPYSDVWGLVGGRTRVSVHSFNIWEELLLTRPAIRFSQDGEGYPPLLPHELMMTPPGMEDETIEAAIARVAEAIR